jgi:septal ring factor EnvC (AmiA/AmiB activator)
MRRNWPSLLILLAFSCTLFSLLPALAGAETEEERTRVRLEKLKTNMAQLSIELQRDMQQRGSLQSALRDSEIAIGKIRKDIEQTRRRLDNTEAELVKLRSQRQQLLVARGEQQELMTREIQTAYQMGKQSQLKILLNQERPDTLARAMAYYEYFYDARQAHIERYLAIITEINTLEPQISSAAQQLEQTRVTLAQQETELVAGKQQRQLDLKQIDAGIRGKDAQLQQMAQDSAELERLLEVIEQAIAEMEVPQPQDDRPFAELKGDMPWPVAGKAGNRYGGKRGTSSMRWQGLMIRAEEGSNVNAVHQGRVVFADWFRGSGLLLIIDHGNGYMSLYAHNQALLRDVGEWVSAGAPVAKVGNSGGQRDAALYFEIRQNGKPVNPGSWLARG